MAMKGINDVAKPLIYGETSTYSILEDAEILNAAKPFGLDSDGIKKNAIKLIDYVDDCAYCKQCPGLEKCAKNSPRTVVELKVEDGELVSSLNFCPKEAKRKAISSNYLYRDYPAEWEDTSIATMVKTARNKKLHAAMRGLLKEGEKNILYVHGEPGCGRTYLMATFTNYLAERGRRIAFIDCSKRLEELKALEIKNKALFDESLEAIESVDYLVLDEFGNWFMSDYILSTILLPILLERFKNRKATVIASDFALNEVGKTFGGGANGALRAKQLVSKLNDLAVVQKLEKGVEQKL